MVITDIQFLVTGFRFEEPMKVAFATITDMDSCIVKILTDEGITGYGEAAPLPFVTGDNLGTVLAVGKDLRDALLGMDPRAIGAVWRRRRRHQRSRSGHGIGARDQAGDV